MTEKELKRLSRLELLEMLVAQIQENEELQKKLNEATEQLNSRDITIEKAGSLAEAALQLNDVFNAADRAAVQYLENIRRLSTTQEELCKKMLSDAQEKAKEIIKQAEEAARNYEKHEVKEEPLEASEDDNVSEEVSLDVPEASEEKRE